jgi:hypothetical protein
MVFSQGERLQVPQNKSVLRGNLDVEIATCSYCQQMGH